MITRRRAYGYTIVELLMALTVLAIGTAGVIAMQKVAIESNRYAKNLSIATRVGEAWADELTADAQLWTYKAGVPTTLNNTDWLNNVTNLSWFRPAFSARRQFGPAFSPLGIPLDPNTQGPLAHFCVDLRLAILRPELASLPSVPTSGDGVIRAQIRVFWPRDDVSIPPSNAATANVCDAANGPGVNDQNISAYHVIYLTTTVRQPPQGRAS